jgi:hypothetical protein
MNNTRTLWQPWLLLIFFALLAACDEEEPVTNNNTTALDTTAVVSTTSWNVDEVTAGNDALDAQNAQVNFEPGGEYTLLIPGYSGLETTGDWSFSDDKKAIILDDGTIEVSATIVSISEQAMVIEFEYDNYKGDPITYRITLSS